MQRKISRTKKYRKNKRRIIALFLLIVCIVLTAFFACSRLNKQETDEWLLYGRLKTNEYNWDETGVSLNNTDENSAGEHDMNGSNNEANNAGISSADEKAWCLTLVNKWNPMKTDGSEIETVQLSNGERVAMRIYPQLQSMFDAARENGVYPIVASGYRTRSEQEELYYDKIAAYKAEGYSEAEAKEAAELWVAIPGTSEHQLGLAVDINADGIRSAGQEVYDWLAQNAYKYGFIHRYPSDKTEITGVANEPWHYRYVGVEAAAEIHSQGICLEEYLEN